MRDQAIVPWSETRRRESERGQSIVLIALLMIAMLAMLGLVLDGGQVYGARRTSQNAADAAAFAGVRLLATHYVTVTEAAIWNTITNYAQANGVITSTHVMATFITASSTDICRINQNCDGIPANATGVRVTTTLQVEPFFIDVIIGSQMIPVSAVAAAQAGPATIGSELAPMSIKFPCPYPPANPSDPACTFHYDQDYQIFGNPQFPGGFQWVDYSCGSTVGDIINYLTMTWTSGAILADRSDTYYNPSNPTQYNSPPPSPNPWVCSGPGMDQSNNLRDALDCWLFPATSGCWVSHPYPGNRNWTVPVFDHDNTLTGSNAKYHTVAFAEFEFRGYWFGNNQCNFLGNPNPKTCPAYADLPPPLQVCANQASTCKDTCIAQRTLCETPCPQGNNPCRAACTDQYNTCLDTCDKKSKCLMGQFKREVDNLDILPGTCNTNGLDVCGIGLSQ